MTMESGARLRKARLAAGFASASAAARALGQKVPTYIHHENGTRDFDADAALMYARRFGVKSEWLLYGRSEMRDLNSDNSLEPISIKSDRIPILGEVAAGMWLETGALDGFESSRGVVPLPVLPDFPSDASFALVVRGTSINRIADDGDILICIDIAKTGISPRDGDLVIVERLRGQEGLREVTAKRFRIADSGYQLWPESTDERWQSPLVIGDLEGDDCVRIIARVQFAMKEVTGR